MSISKKILILSDGPVPSPEHEKVEGGGLRCWGLARGMKINNDQLDITIAYNENYKKPKTFVDSYESIQLRVWNMDTLAELLVEFDTIIVSYCMGQLSVSVASLIRTDQQLVLDCYVPIYVEVSARDSKNVEAEYAAFHGDIGRWSHVLARGDFFLCASDAQRAYYRGVLSAIGRLNPANYNQELILIVPYGIYREKAVATHKPITELIGKNADSYKKVLWFGGIYPWFDLRQLVSAVKKVNATTPAKLIIVGARNPFNQHPDFISRYEELVAYIASNHLQDIVIMQDWVSFSDRANWYLDSDLVVVFNRAGVENSLAWRTRLVDFIWADLPIITNAGDPLGEDLIMHEAAARFSGDTAEAIAKNLEMLLGDEARLAKLRANIEKRKAIYYWDTVTKELSHHIESGDRAGDLVNMGIYQISQGISGYGSNKLTRIVRKAKKLPAYARKNGTMNTVSLVGGIAARKIGKYLPRKSAKGRMVFVSHQLDMSGAPFVLMDMVSQVMSQHPKLPIDFFTFTPVHHINVTTLNRLGIKPKIIIDRNVIPEVYDNDIVVLNTSAHSEGFKEELFSRLESGKLRKLVWYIHEDDPELIFRHDEHIRMKKLLQSGKLKILIAAKKMRHNYTKFFGNEESIVYQTYKLITEKKYHRTLTAKDFTEKLSFILPGTVGDGRKGQLPLFYAFAAFYKQHFLLEPSKYREFELVYVGVIDDFLSRQLLKHKETLGSGRFKAHGRLTKHENLNVVMRSNITVCYSMRECLPLFVFEGMITGHPILRNDSSGIDEQLEEGKNGYEIDSGDYWQVVATIERIMNKTTTSDEQLAAMSSRSYEIAKSQEDHSYLPGLETEIALLEFKSRA